MKVGLLHTVPGLAPMFDALVREAVPEADIVHLVNAPLLAAALTRSPQVVTETRESLAALVDLGCAAILVTCSSLGEFATATDPLGEFGVPLLRVDGPMALAAARHAVATGPNGRIVVLATQPSTLDPSTRLVAEAVAALAADGSVPTVEGVLVADAAESLAAGDRDSFERLLRAAATTAAEECVAIVAAQASMADVFEDFDPGVPVFTSPRSGVAALVRIASTS
ncbi:MAG: aspartate/glutamate racemase family protein [Promicromonosporaceae bacterium]|nr:aspartate/glutamate racemase family protein [Promicromonosporaceae bacterium]